MFRIEYQLANVGRYRWRYHKPKS